MNTRRPREGALIIIFGSALGAGDLDPPGHRLGPAPGPRSTRTRGPWVATRKSAHHPASIGLALLALPQQLEADRP